MNVLKSLRSETLSDYVLDLAWSGDGEFLAATPTTGPIAVFDEKGVAAELPEHGLTNGASGWTATTLATCGADKKLRCYSGSWDAPAWEFKAEAGWFERARWNRDGTRLAASAAKTLYVLSAAGAVVTKFPDHQSTVTDFAWNPRETDEVATVCAGGARMWRIGASKAFAKFDWGGASLTVAWSPTGRWIVTGDQSASVHLYDFERDYPLHIQGYETKVKAMDFSPSGAWLATGGGPFPTIWPCTGKTGPEGKTPKQLDGHAVEVAALAYSPDGSQLATGDVSGRLLVFDGKAPEKALRSHRFQDAISTVAWHPKGHILAVGTAGGRVEYLSL